MFVRLLCVSTLLSVFHDTTPLLKILFSLHSTNSQTKLIAQLFVLEVFSFQFYSLYLVFFLSACNGYDCPCFDWKYWKGNGRIFENKTH